MQPFAPLSTAIAQSMAGLEKTDPIRNPSANRSTMRHPRNRPHADIVSRLAAPLMRRGRNCGNKERTHSAARSRVHRAHPTRKPVQPSHGITPHRIVKPARTANTLTCEPSTVGLRSGIHPTHRMLPTTDFQPPKKGGLAIRKAILHSLEPDHCQATISSPEAER